MISRRLRAATLVCAVAALFGLLSGCSLLHRDPTETPENVKNTEKRQAIIAKHKQDN